MGPQNVREFVVTTEGPHYGQPCLVIENPTKIERHWLKSILLANEAGDERYEMHEKGEPFLQSDSPDFMLIEFWNNDYQEFVNWLNSGARKFLKHSANYLKHMPEIDEDIKTVSELLREDL